MLEKLIIDQDIFQVIGMALLTIWISISIAIFSYKEKDFDNLDRNVVLDHVVRSKFTLFYLGLIFLPLIFWNTSSPCWRLIELISWGLGIYFMTTILINSYHWLKGKKFNLRFDYLKKVDDLNDMEDSWRSVWETKDVNTQNERDFFKIFTAVIDKSFESQKTVFKLLSDFTTFIEKRSTSFLLVFREVLPKVLDWHFKTWGKEQVYLQKNDKSDKWLYYNALLRNIEELIGKIEERALKEGDGYSFFQDFKKHVSEHKEEIDSVDKKTYYIEELFGVFYQIYFENTSTSKGDIWRHNFPKEWKITKANLESQIEARISFNNFLSWAGERIQSVKEEFDDKLDDVSRNLFPELEPLAWARILIFLYSPYGEIRVKSMIERAWNFGRGRSRGYSFSVEEDEKEVEKRMKQMVELQENTEKEKTFEFASLLFKQQFSKEKLEKYIADINQLIYAIDSKEDLKKQALLSLFQEMLQFMNKQVVGVKN
jgi:hypothetical protein